MRGNFPHIVCGGELHNAKHPSCSARCWLHLISLCRYGRAEGAVRGEAAADPSSSASARQRDRRGGGSLQLQRRHQRGIVTQKGTQLRVSVRTKDGNSIEFFSDVRYQYCNLKYLPTIIEPILSIRSSHPYLF